ncbi:hypothetical protein [Oscillatoria salina]|nr:hypothetical protein [Oscillatoria salina]MBZ8182209.1 hypothetical protein [Oscillatoria salina IIICB1]
MSEAKDDLNTRKQLFVKPHRKTISAIANRPIFPDAIAPDDSDTHK